MRIVRPCSLVPALLMMAATSSAFQPESSTNRLEFPLAWESESRLGTFERATTLSASRYWPSTYPHLISIALFSLAKSTTMI